MQIHSLLNYKAIGLAFYESKRENSFDRLPFIFKDKVRKEVWNLSKNNSGISIEFLTDSSFIEFEWEVINNFTMNHMPNTGIKGLDLYTKSNNEWIYVGTGIPEGKKNFCRIIQNMEFHKREYKLYLPLYDGIEKLDIKLQDGSILEDLNNKQETKPLVFYGTSITQGGCASRPGSIHTNIISRATSLECMNFGFSGNGHLEKSIGEIISQINAKLYIIECMQNVDEILLKDRLIPLVKVIRQKRKMTPIVFVIEPISKNEDLDLEIKKNLTHKNKQLRIQYKKIKKLNIPQVYLIDEPNGIGIDNESTVDTVHFNDIGFRRYAFYLLKNLKKLQLL